jgi:hypothetical protein
MFLVGGGFVPTFAGIIAGVAGTRVDAPLIWWRTRGSGRMAALLAKLWPWPLVLLLAWLPSGWILGHFFNQALMSLVFVLFFLIDLGFPVLAVLGGLARDARRTFADSTSGSETQPVIDGTSGRTRSGA